MLVSVIVPAYKKEESIIEDITNIFNAMSETRYDFELIVVEDGYLDNTHEVFSTYLKENSNISSKVNFIGYKRNRGKGYALRYGMARARGDYVAFIDSGMEINPNGISLMLEHMIWYDAHIIVGSKRHPASRTNMQLMRKIYSWGYYWFVKLLFGLHVSDTQTGLKVFRKDVLQDVLPRLLVKEFAIDIEILAVANYLGYTRIYDAPVEIDLKFTQDSKFSAKKPLFLDKFVRMMVRDTLAVFYRMHILEYYSDKSHRKWTYDEELRMRVNTGEMFSEGEFIGMLSDLGQEIPKETAFPKFSIIIPVRSVNDYLKENIKHLKKLDYDNFEVLIILDDQPTYKVKDSRFRYIAVGPLSPGEKRNLGARNATGEILAFLDDDAYPNTNWLSEAAKVFRDPEIYALGAPAITPKNAEFLEKCSGRVLESFLTSGDTIHRHVPQSRRLVNDYPTVNFFVRKHDFFGVGGFTKDFWPGEDTKLCLDLIKEKQRDFVYDPNPIVYHHRRKLFVPHLKQVSRYGRHRGQFAKVFPENSRVLSYFVPSLFLLGVIFGPIISLIYPPLFLFYTFVILCYLGLIVYESTRVILHDKNLLAGFYVALGIMATHFIYGLNFIVGLVKRPTLQLRSFDSSTGNYLGG
ncbi:MAG: glycosyltransferase [Patescibacteria group bacterium]